MASETALIAGVGFRHVIEDGLAVLSREHLDPGRRKYVVDDITNLLRDASRGLELVNRSTLFVNSDERSAVDAFSLLNRYLGHGHGQDWGKQLPAAEKAFDELQKNSEPSDDIRAAAADLLQELLIRVQRQSWTGIPEQPEDIRIFE